MNVDYNIYCETLATIMKEIREERQKLIKRYRKRFSNVLLDKWIEVKN